MPVPTPSWAVRNGLNAELLDSAGRNPADEVTYDNTTSGLTATDVQAAIDEVAAGAGTALTVEDEGTPLATDADTLNFVGAGVSASGTGTTKTITIPGGASALDDLTDVTITSPATNDRLAYNGTVWVNSAGIWRPLMDGAGAVVTDGGTGEAIMALS